MKLSKVHIALLTNVTEGKVKNEHITMYYSKEVTAKTVLQKMVELNKILPVDLYHVAEKSSPSIFRSWNGEQITNVSLSKNHEDAAGIFFNGFTVDRPHITLAKDQTDQGYENLRTFWPKFNWNEGLKVGECHVGWKENGEMVYRTETELIDWIANNA